jgi:DNA polymerase epsilon subunit 1
MEKKRDPQLVQRVWQCPQCDHPYDLELIEQTLIDTWSQKLLSYQLQDLVCTKCHQVKREHMPLLCSCSGFYTTKIHHQSFTEEMQTFHRIAKYHKFELLEEFVTWNVDLANGASF